MSDMTDRDVRRDTADEIASLLETRSEQVTAHSKGLRGDEFWLAVGMARGLSQAAVLAAKTGRRDPA